MEISLQKDQKTFQNVIYCRGDSVRVEGVRIPDLYSILYVVYFDQLSGAACT